MSSPSSSFEKPPPHRANNPFSERQRDNFPSLDAAFLKNHSIEIESTCSQGSSFLNISIGARAALTEHLRHVAKYGIDGEKNGEEREEAIEINLVDEEKHPLDEQWDHILSDDHSSVVNGSFSPLDCIEASAVDTSFTGLTDVSNSADYFNSSRVNLLVTPERNKNKSGMVVTREEAMMPYDEEDDYCSSSSNFAAAPEILRAQHQEEEFPRVLSFNSLNGVDISRISNADSDVLPRRGLDQSFQDQQRLFSEEDAFSNIYEDLPHSSSIHESSFSSTPLRHPPASRETTPRPLSKQGRLPRAIRSKENDDPFSSPAVILHGSASPLATRQVNDSLEKMSNDLLKALPKGAEPSPIRPRIQRNKPKSSPPTLTGRKVYRTVVPRRVFLDSQPGDFPEEQDSFSIPHKDDSSPAKSLMNSFEAVAEVVAI